MFENPRRGRQARHFTTNAPKILDLKSSSEQIFSRKLPLGAPEVCLALEDFKKLLGCMCFLIMFSYGSCARKPFAWKVMLSVLSLLTLHDFLLSSVALWSLTRPQSTND